MSDITAGAPKGKVNKVRNKIKRTPSEVVLDVILYIVLTLFAIVCFYPLYQVVVVSFSDPAIVQAKNATLLYPQGAHVDAYKVVLSNKNLWNGFKNTMFYIVVGVSLEMLCTFLTAYPLSKPNAMLKRPIMFFFAFTMYFGGGLVPFYILITQLHLFNTPWAIILPGMCNVWNCILMRTQFVNVPSGLREAAIIDGANDFRVLFQVLVPLSGSVIAVLVLFSVVGYWNMWYEPMLYLTKRADYPLQSVLREILIDANSQMMAGSGNVQTKINKSAANVKILIKYANIVVSTVPILVVYPFAQKYFVKGVMIGSMKG